MHDDPSVGNRVLDNEIYDCNDNIQITHNSGGNNHYVECRDAVIEGNDLYLTGDRHVLRADGSYALAENAIDIKAGPRSVDEPMRVVRNRIWVSVDP